MRIYWYWPTPHLQVHPWPLATARTGDEVTVHSLVPPKDRTTETVTGYLLRRELPRPSTGRRAGGPHWWASRAASYLRRAYLRERVVRMGDHDICHIHHVNLSTDFWAIPRLRRFAPVVLTVNDVIPHVRRLPGAVERHLLLRAYREADALIVYHSALKDELSTTFGIDPFKIFVIPHPIRATNRRETVEATDNTVLFFGTFRPNKGIDVLLEAIRRVPRDLHARFVFAGAGERMLEEKVRAAARWDGRIHHEISRVSNDRRDDLFRSARLVVLPYSEFHSQSGVLADAYAFGRPVVATDVGALGHSVREDRSGWVVPPDDPQDLACALIDALRDREGRTVAGKAAFKAGRERTYSAVGRQLRTVYDHVVIDSGATCASRESS